MGLCDISVGDKIAFSWIKGSKAILYANVVRIDAESFMTDLGMKVSFDDIEAVLKQTGEFYRL